jgi:hypothetical protein
MGSAVRDVLRHHNGAPGRIRTCDRWIRRSRWRGYQPAATLLDQRKQLATSDIVLGNLPMPCGLDADCRPAALSAWESHRVGVLPKSDTGHVGHERPGLPLLVSGLWPADGPPTAALQSVIDRVSRCPRVSSDAGPPRSAIVDHRGDLLGAGWFAALSLPHTVPRRSWRAGSNRLRADRPATELLPATASSVSDLETS